MRDESGLDFGGRNVDAAHLQHVITASGVDVVASFIDVIFVTAAYPGAQESLRCFLAIAPVGVCSSRSTDVQLANLPGGDGLTILIDQPELIAGHRRAGSAVTNVSGAIGQKDVQHLRGADTVQNVHAKVALPALADVSRQRLAGGDTSS